MSNFDLTVKSDFESFKRGQRITDATEIERILGSEMAVHVLKVHRQAFPAAAEKVSTDAAKPAAPAEPQKKD